MLKNIYKKKSIFVMLMLPISTILVVITLITGAIGYSISRNTLNNELNSYNDLLLSYLTNEVDEKIIGIYNSMAQIIFDKSVNEFSAAPVSLWYINISSINEQLRTLTLSNKIVDQCFIFYKDPDTLLDGMGTNYPRIYFPGKYDFDMDFVSTFSGVHDFTILSKHNRKDNNNYLIIIKSFPVKNPYGYVIVLVNQNNLINIIDSSGKYNNSAFMIANENGEILLSYLPSSFGNINSKTESLIDSKEHFVGKRQSKYFKCQYMIVRYISDMEKNFNHIGRLTVVIDFIAFLIGIILAYVLSRYFHRPIKNIITTISSASLNSDIVEKNEFDYILQSIKEYIIQIPNIKAYHLINLLKHGFTKDVSESDLSFISLYYPNPYFQVCKVIETGSSLEEGYLAQKLSDIMNCSAFCNCVKADDRYFVLIINWKYYPEDSEIKRSMQQIRGVLENDKYMVHIGAGNVYEGIGNLHKSYEEAGEALLFRDSSEEVQALYYSDIASMGFYRLHYPIESEKYIINNLKLGHEEEVIEEVERLFRPNSKCNFTYKEQHDLIVEIYNSLVKVLFEEDVKLQDINAEIPYDISGKLDSMGSISEMKAWLKHVLKDCAGHFARHKSEGNKKLLDYIISYIKENMDKDLYLGLLAERTGLTARYLSGVLREETGMSFLNYLNSLRIEKAKEILRTDTRIKIKDIASMVGYNNYLNFIRTFKKYEGISPGDYRDMAK